MSFGKCERVSCAAFPSITIRTSSPTTSSSVTRRSRSHGTSDRAARGGASPCGARGGPPHTGRPVPGREVVKKTDNEISTSGYGADGRPDPAAAADGRGTAPRARRDPGARPHPRPGTARRGDHRHRGDRKSGLLGKRVAERVDIGGRRSTKHKKKETN